MLLNTKTVEQLCIAGHAKVEEATKQELETLLKIQRKSFFN
jgi:hypothetical protein